MYKNAQSSGKIIRRLKTGLSREHTEQSSENMKSPEEIYQNIHAAMGNKQPEELIEEIERLAASFPEFALAHNDLGVLYYNTDKKEKALYHYRKAVQLEPENITFRKNLADFLYVESGRVEEALQIYVNILAVHPGDVEALLALGHICVALKKFDDAMDFYNRVLEVEPWNTDARQNLNKLQKDQLNDLKAESPDEIYRDIQNMISAITPEEAISKFENLVNSFPHFALAHNDLGVLHYNTGDKEKALHYYRKAVQLEPENITSQKNLADFLYVESGQVEEALQIFVNILAAHPDDVETLLVTGHICIALEKFDDAGNFYNRVLEIEPENENAGQNLKALKNYF